MSEEIQMYPVSQSLLAVQTVMKIPKKIFLIILSITIFSFLFTGFQYLMFIPGIIVLIVLSRICKEDPLIIEIIAINLFKKRYLNP